MVVTPANSRKYFLQRARKISEFHAELFQYVTKAHEFSSQPGFTSYVVPGNPRCTAIPDTHTRRILSVWNLLLSSALALPATPADIRLAVPTANPTDTRGNG